MQRSKPPRSGPTGPQVSNPAPPLRRRRSPLVGTAGSIAVHACLLLLCGAATVTSAMKTAEPAPDTPIQIRLVASEPVRPLPSDPSEAPRPPSENRETPHEETPATDDLPASLEDALAGPLPARTRADHAPRPPTPIRESRALEAPRPAALPSLVAPAPVDSDPPPNTARNPRAASPSEQAILPSPRNAVHLPTVATHPVLTANQRPQYPESCTRSGHEGTVELELTVAADGTVATTQLIRSSGCEELDRSARLTALKLRYEPATRGGIPVTGTIRWRVHFHLDSR